MPAIVRQSSFGEPSPQKQTLVTSDQIRSFAAIGEPLGGASGKLTSQGILLRHSTQVQALAVSKDGRWLACAPDDFSATLWDIATGTATRTFRFQNIVQAIVFSPDNQKLAVSTQGGEIQVWGLSDAKPTAIKKFPAVPSQIVYTPDGGVLIAAFWDGSIRLLLASNLTEQKALQAHKRSTLCIALSPSGKILATGGLDADRDSSGNGPGVVKIWSYPNLVQLRSIDAHSKAIRALAFRRDEKFLVSASDDHTTKVWEVATGSLKTTQEGHQDSVRAAAFSPNGEKLVTGGQDGLTMFWSGSTFELVRASPLYAGFISGLEFLPRSNQLVRAGSTLDIVSAEHPSDYKRLESYAAGVYTTVLSRSAKWFASGGADGQLRVLNLGSGDIRKVSAQGCVTAAALSNDDAWIAVGDNTGRISVLSPATLREVASMNGHVGSVTSLVFTEKTLISAGDDGALCVWDKTSWGKKGEVQAHDDRISGIGVSEDGTVVYSCSLDGTIKAWHLPSQEPVAKVSSGVYSPLSISVCKDEVAVGTFGGTILFLDKGSLSEKGTARGDNRPVLALSFSPDGTHLASGDDRGQVALWNSDTYEALGVSSVSNLEVFSITWYPNSQGMITGDGHSDVRLWLLGKSQTEHARPADKTRDVCPFCGQPCLIVGPHSNPHKCRNGHEWFID
jgi:WD40 repeat protein